MSAIKALFITFTSYLFLKSIRTIVRLLDPYLNKLKKHYKSMLTPYSFNSALSRISVFGKNYNNDFFLNKIFKWYYSISYYY